MTAGWFGLSRCKRSQYLVPLLSFFIGVCLTLELSSWSEKQKREHVPFRPRAEIEAVGIEVGVELSPTVPAAAASFSSIPPPTKPVVLVARKETTVKEEETESEEEIEARDGTTNDTDVSFPSPLSVSVSPRFSPVVRDSGVFRVATKVSHQTRLNTTVSVSLHEEGASSLEEEEGAEEEVEEVESLASLQAQLGRLAEEQGLKAKEVVLMRPIIRQSETDSEGTPSNASTGGGLGPLDGNGSSEKEEGHSGEEKRQEQGEREGGPMLSEASKAMPLEVKRGDPLKCNGLSLDDVAVAVLHNIESPSASGRYTSFRAAWIRHFKNKLLYVKHREGSLGSDYLNIITHLKKKFPKKKWYLMVHDDTFVYSYNLLCYLANYNKNQPMILGSTHCRGPNFTCKSGGILDSSGQGGQGGEGGKGSWLGWTNGGAGIVISSKAAHKLNVKSCMKYYTNKKHWDYRIAAADVIFSCCGKDSNLQKIHNPGFVNGRPGFQECQCQKLGQPLCTLKGMNVPRGSRGGAHLISSSQDPLLQRRLTYHHVAPHLMSHLFWAEYEALGPKYKRAAVFDLNQAKIIHVKGKRKD